MEEKKEPLNKFEISQTHEINKKSKKPLLVGVSIFMFIFVLLIL
jgi:hypothetical protein